MVSYMYVKKSAYTTLDTLIEGEELTPTGTYSNCDCVFVDFAEELGGEDKTTLDTAMTNQGFTYLMLVS